MASDFTGDEIIFADHDQGSGCSGPAAIVEALLAELAWLPMMRRIAEAAIAKVRQRFNNDIQFMMT
jgi:hypothetical protein